MINVDALREDYSVMNVKKAQESDEAPKSIGYKGLLDALIPVASVSLVKLAITSGVFTFTPLVAYADTFGDIHSTVMSLFDGAVVLIIIFAGGAWALGHRDKGVHLLLSVSCGYLLARHAVDIRDYLKGIGGGA